MSFTTRNTAYKKVESYENSGIVAIAAIFENVQKRKE